MIFHIALSDNSNLNANGYSQDEENEIYNHTLDAVLSNTRWYLDNLEKLPTYRLSWHAYNSKKTNIPAPLPFCIKRVNAEKANLALNSSKNGE